MRELDDSPFVGHEPCPSCGSRDNLARYASGRGYCHGCGYKEYPDDYTSTKKGQTMDNNSKQFTPRKGEYKSIVDKYGLNLETCKKLNIQVIEASPKVIDSDGNKVTLRTRKCLAFNYVKDGKIWGQKIRIKLDEQEALEYDKEKTYAFPNAGGHPPLFGQHLWAEGCDTRILRIFEGEGDVGAFCQLTGFSKPAVSIPTGASGAVDAIKHNYDFINRFDKVVVIFDNDDKGREFSKKVAEMLPAGKTYTAFTQGHKDARTVLMEGSSEEKKALQWIGENAEQFMPDGIFTLTDIKEAVLTPPEQGRPWWDPRVTAWTYGRRAGETYVFGAGTSIGKTDWFTQSIAFDVLELNVKTGVIYLEQNPTETGKRLAGKVAGRSFHIPVGEDNKWTNEELLEAVEKLEATGCLFLGGNFAANSWEQIDTRIRYMRHALGVEHLYLDHLTALADPNKEQESVATLIKNIALLCQELGMIFHVISHLATPEGKSHEEGARVLPKHFRGSRAIQYWAHYMFGLERNIQTEDPEEILYSTFRCVKDRYTGRASGKTVHYRYDRETGRFALSEAYNKPALSEEMQKAIAELDI